jgi:hypothetical protein
MAELPPVLAEAEAFVNHTVGPQLAPNLSTPEFLKEVAAIQDEEARLLQLQERKLALSAYIDDTRKEMRKQMLDMYDKRFEGYDWKKALIGFGDTLPLNIFDHAIYNVKPPNAGAMTEMQKQEAGNTEELLTVALWLQTVEYSADMLEKLPPEIREKARAPMQVARMDLEMRLKYCRTIMPHVLSMLARICNELHSWLQLKMEDNLGNFCRIQKSGIR